MYDYGPKQFALRFRFSVGPTQLAPPLLLLHDPDLDPWFVRLLGWLSALVDWHRAVTTRHFGWRGCASRSANPCTLALEFSNLDYDEQDLDSNGPLSCSPDSLLWTLDSGQHPSQEI